MRRHVEPGELSSGPLGAAHSAQMMSALALMHTQPFYSPEYFFDTGNKPCAHVVEAAGDA